MVDTTRPGTGLTARANRRNPVKMTSAKSRCSAAWSRVLDARRDRDVGEVTDALDLTYDIAGDHGEDCRVTFGKTDRALARIARRLRRLRR
jgi:hypothetical protein